MTSQYIEPKRLQLKSHPDYDEKWVQNLIQEDPSILRLGDLVLRDAERIQPKAGRLDLLLQDPDTFRRYEVEIQLGATDESHIIRTIEYWDIERKRYPQYDHCAVIVAEDITSRFLNLISLFNGTIPLIAIQMQAMNVGEYTTLVFTKVLDEFARGMVDEDEEAEAAPTDRSYWENKATLETVKLADKMFEIVREIDPDLSLKYNKYYIGLEKNGRANNFISFKPRKSQLNLSLRLPKSEEIDSLIEQGQFDTLEYSRQKYRLVLNEDVVSEKRDQIKQLMNLAHEHLSST